MARQKTKRFAAKLFFQFRAMVDGSPGKRRFCEERIIQFKAPRARDALRLAKSKGKEAQFNYKNSDGNKVFFEFIGVMELLCLDSICDAGEVWYEIEQYLLPKERKSKFIPKEKDLDAIRYNA